MNPGGLYPESPNTIALIGNHLPRRCGIATFTADLLEALSIEAPEMDCWAVVMNDVPEGYFYPTKVCFEWKSTLSFTTDSWASRSCASFWEPPTYS